MSIFDIVDAIRRTEINPLPRIKTLFSHNEGLTWLGITLAVYTLAQASLNSILFLYANVRLGWGSFETGIFLSTLGLAILVSQAVLAPACVWAVGEHGTIYLGFALTAVHFAIYGFANNTALMYVGLAVGSLGFVCDPPIKAIVARQVDSHTQGSLQGSLSGLTAVVKPFGPLFSTALFSLGIRIGIIGLPLYGTAFIMALTIPCASIAFRKAGLK